VQLEGTAPQDLSQGDCLSTGKCGLMGIDDDVDVTAEKLLSSALQQEAKSLSPRELDMLKQLDSGATVARLVEGNGDAEEEFRKVLMESHVL